MRRTTLHLPALPTPGHVAHLARARLAPPAIDRRSADEVMARYGLTATRAPVTLPGRRNANVRVRSATGEHVLRRYRDGWHLSSIEHEHAILVELERLSFPAVRLLRDHDGHTIVHHDDRWHALFRFEAGRSITGLRLGSVHTAALLRQAGATLARFHQTLADFRPGWAHHTEAMVAPLPPLGETAGRTAGRAGALDERIARLDEQLAGADLPRTIIHTDFGPHNLLFRPDAEPVVCDLELARPGRRLSDLLALADQFRPRTAELLLEGYRSIDDLTGDEVDLVPVLWEHDLLQAGLRSWWNYQGLGGDARLRTADSRFERASRPPTLIGLTR